MCEKSVSSVSLYLGLIALMLASSPVLATDWGQPGQSSTQRNRASVSGDIVVGGERWRFPIGGSPNGDFVGGDFDEDGLNETLVVQGGALRRFDDLGRIVWDTPAGRYGSILDVGDVNADGEADVALSAQSGDQMLILSVATGSEEWHQALGASAVAAGRFGDFDGDGDLEWLEAGPFDTIALWEFGPLDPETGRFTEIDELWRTANEVSWGPCAMTPVELDGEPAPEIFCPRTSDAWVINGEDGSNAYEMFPLDDYYGGAPGIRLIRDVTGDGTEEVFLYNYSYVYDLDAGLTALTFDSGAPEVLWREFTALEVEDDVEYEFGGGADLDGDGSIEIVYGRYDAGLDGWNVLVADAGTNALKASVPGTLAQLADLDGDGTVEILVRETDGFDLELPGRVEVWRLADSGAMVRLGFIDGIDALLLVDDMDHDGSAEIWATQDLDVDHVAEATLALTWNGGELDELLFEDPSSGTLASFPRQIPAYPSAGDSRAAVHAGGELLQVDSTGTVTSRTSLGGFRTHALDVVTEDGHRTLVQNSLGELVLLDATGATAEDAPVVERTLPRVDRGRTIVAFEVEDLDSDGVDEIIVLRHNDGQLEVAVYPPDGDARWRRVAPALLPQAESAAVFVDQNQDGVLDVVINRTSWYSVADASLVNSLDVWSGDDGAVLATVTNATMPACTGADRDSLRAFWRMSTVADVTGDGVDELLLTGYSMEAVDLVSMTELACVSLGGSQMSSVAQQMEADGDARPEIVFGAHGSFNLGRNPITTVLDIAEGPAFEAYWSSGEAFADAPRLNDGTGIVRTQARGPLEDVVDSSVGGAIAAKRGDTGALVWSTHLFGGDTSRDIADPTNIVTNLATGDLDVSNPGDEVALVDKEGWLYFLDSDDGALLWSLRVHGTAGTISAFDAQNRGQAELVFSTDRGFVYGVGVAELETPVVADAQVDEHCSLGNLGDVDSQPLGACSALSWSQVDGADSYLVRLETEAGSAIVDWTAVPDPASRSFVFTALNLTPTLRYRHRVRAISGARVSPAGDSDGFVVEDSAPPEVVWVEVAEPVLSPALGERQSIVATFRDSTRLQRGTISITGPADDPTVRAAIMHPLEGLEDSLLLEWDGQVDDSQAPDGEYEVAVTVLDNSRHAATSSATFTVTSDTDDDGVLDTDDNCPRVSNTGQSDIDDDDDGDVCDGDLDGDRVINEGDNCPAVANRDQLDTDGDGQGDACDDDDDDDEVLDPVDNCPLVANTGQTDSDHDGLGDACDPTGHTARGGCSCRAAGGNPDDASWVGAAILLVAFVARRRSRGRSATAAPERSAR